MSVRIVLLGEITAPEVLQGLFGHDGWQIVAETLRFREIRDLIESFKPDLVIVKPAEHEREEVVRLAQVCAYTRIILLFNQGSPQCVADALDRGIRGYVLTSEMPGGLLSAMHEVTRGHVYVSAGISRDEVDALRLGSVPANDPLTLRERQVLQLIAEGNSTKDLALLLGISVKTAESHRTHLMQKLDIHETASLVRYAFRHGIVNP